MMLAGNDVTEQPLAVRQDLLERKVLPTLTEPVRYAIDRSMRAARATASTPATREQEPGREGQVANI